MSSIARTPPKGVSPVPVAAVPANALPPGAAAAGALHPVGAPPPDVTIGVYAGGPIGTPQEAHAALTGLGRSVVMVSSTAATLKTGLFALTRYVEGLEAELLRRQGELTDISSRLRDSVPLGDYDTLSKEHKDLEGKFKLLQAEIRGYEEKIAVLRQRLENAQKGSVSSDEYRALVANAESLGGQLKSLEAEMGALERSAAAAGAHATVTESMLRGLLEMIAPARDVISGMEGLLDGVLEQLSKLMKGSETYGKMESAREKLKRIREALDKALAVELPKRPEKKLAAPVVPVKPAAPIAPASIPVPAVAPVAKLTPSPVASSAFAPPAAIPAPAAPAPVSAAAPASAVPRIVGVAGPESTLASLIQRYLPSHAATAVADADIAWKVLQNLFRKEGHAAKIVEEFAYIVGNAVSIPGDEIRGVLGRLIQGTANGQEDLNHVFGHTVELVIFARMLRDGRRDVSKPSTLGSKVAAVQLGAAGIFARLAHGSRQAFVDSQEVVDADIVEGQGADRVIFEVKASDLPGLIARILERYMQGAKHFDMPEHDKFLDKDRPPDEIRRKLAQEAKDIEVSIAFANQILRYKAAIDKGHAKSLEIHIIRGAGVSEDVIAAVYKLFGQDPNSPKGPVKIVWYRDMFAHGEKLPLPRKVIQEVRTSSPAPAPAPVRKTPPHGTQISRPWAIIPEEDAKTRLAKLATESGVGGVFDWSGHSWTGLITYRGVLALLDRLQKMPLVRQEADMASAIQNFAYELRAVSGNLDNQFDVKRYGGDILKIGRWFRWIELGKRV